MIKKKENSIYDLLIVGSGPSGIMCAAQASKKFDKICIVDLNKRPLLRLLASGGGRCNVSNIMSKKDFIKGIVKGWEFISKSFNKFNNLHVKKYFEDMGVPLKVEEGKYLFPQNDDSEDIAERLLYDVDWEKTDYISGEVIDVDKNGQIFTVKTNNIQISAKRLVFATGGKSFKNLGISNICEKICNKFGIKYDNKYEACNVPLKTKETFKAIQGVSLGNVTISYDDVSIQGPMLFTHFGLSGPVVIRISSHIKKFPSSIRINFVCKKNEVFYSEFSEQCRKNPTKKIYNNLQLITGFPSSFCKWIIDDNEDNSGNIKKDFYNLICDRLTNYEVNLISKMPIDIAFTTSGGVDLSEVNPENMESYKVKHLYFIGECLDIVAYTGGYNISTWFSLGYSCGKEMK